MVDSTRIPSEGEELSSVEALRAAKIYVESIVETIHEPLLVLTPELHVKSANPAFYHDFQVRPQDTLGRWIYELGNGQWNIPGLRTLLEDVLPENHVFNDFEVRHDFQDIGPRVMLVNARQLDHVQLILLGIRDITEQARATEVLRESEERYRTLFDSIDQGFCIVEVLFGGDGEAVDYRFLEVNRAFEAQTGLHHAAGKRMRELEPRHEEHWFRIYGRIARTGEPERLVQQAQHLGGRWYDLYAFRVGRPEQHRVAILFTDITERKRAEETLRASEARHRTLFDAVDQGVCLFERLPPRPDGRRDYRYLAMNPAMQAMFGIPDLSGQSIRESFPDESEAWYDDYDRVLETGEPVRLERASGPRGMVLEMFVTRLEDASGRRLLAVMQDVTERIRAEEAVRESEERFRLFGEASSDVLWIRDAEQLQWEYLSPAFETVYGYRRSEVLGSDDLHHWAELIVPEDRESALAAIERVRGGERVTFEYRIRRPDGEVRWLRNTDFPIRDESGRVRRIGGLGQDVTEQKEVEEALRETKRRAEEASQAKSQFLATMSHELRTPLTGVIGYAELLETEVIGPMTARQQEALSRIKASSWHLVSIIDEILTLTRAEAGKEMVQDEETDVAAIIRDVVGILEPQAESRGLSLRVEGLDVPAPIRTDPGKVRQILMNLLGNALKYAGNGAVEVRLDHSDRGWIEVHVSDTGPGIAPQDQERIFEAFTQIDSSYTRGGSGTGLGLAICRRLARLLGGEVTLRSAAGEGSTFTLRLPRQHGQGVDAP